MDRGLTLLAQREHSKLDKRRRIEAAARAAFTELGYERANMREIAKRAGVATGTLFLYAPDKRNLLLWIVNDDLEPMTAATFAEIADTMSQDSLIDQLLYFFRTRYEYWGVDRDLGLHALQEMPEKRDVPSSPSSHFEFFKLRRRHVYEHIDDLVRDQQRLGRIRAGADPELVTRLALAIFNAQIRHWLRTDATIEQGLADLRALLSLAILGCSTATSGRGAGEMSN